MLVDNAVIMAAGTSSRFAPLSYEKHKAMTVVKGEVLIERQIRQLQEAGIPEIYIVTGYKAEQFEYLSDKFGVKLLHNNEYLTRNNNGSIYVARDVLKNSYICSSDNYFSVNPFEREVSDSYYSALYSDGHTEEWCMTEDDEGFIDSVTVGGENAWYMLGHCFWSESFSKAFLSLLLKEYDREETKGMLWETMYMAHLDTLKMKIRKYESDVIYEFDTLDELRQFDESYVNDTHSAILRDVASRLGVKECDIKNLKSVRGQNAEAIGFEFVCNSERYRFIYDSGDISRI